MHACIHPSIHAYIHSYICTYITYIKKVFLCISSLPKEINIHSLKGKYLIFQAIYHLHFSVVPCLQSFFTSTLRLSGFIPRSSELFSKTMTQAGNRTTLTKHYPNVFQRFGKTHYRNE